MTNQVRKRKTILILFTVLICFNACTSRTVQLLSKKWDCVNVENLNTESNRFQSPEDSVITAQFKAVLQSLTWNFKENREYECAVSGRTVLHGTYHLQDEQKTLICTPDTRNSMNRYTILSLTEDELVLRSNENNPPLMLHFRPH